MSDRRCLCLALAALLLGGAAWTGNTAEPAEGRIAGLVRYTGTVPADQVIPTTDGGMIRHNDLVVDAKTKGLRHVAAVLEDAPAQPKAEKAKPAVIDQRDMVFVPRMISIQHGQAVRFENNDLCNHSVMGISTSKANQFNTVAGPGQPISRVFELQKHPVKIGCALHGWMAAWVVVVPHPWFAVSDELGKFEIGNVPPGKYMLVLSHPDTGLQERQMVVVEAGKTALVKVDWEKAPGK